MPTVNVSFSFSSDNGDAELFISNDDTVHSDGIYDGAVGNPAGSARFDTVVDGSGFEYKEFFRTFEQWGVPAGSIVTGVSNFVADRRYEETGTGNGDHYAGAHCGGGTGFPGSLTIALFNPTAQNGDVAFETLPEGFNSQNLFPRPTTQQFYLTCEVSADLTGGNTAQTWFDNISFDITYTVAGVTGSGVLNAQPATLSAYAQVLPGGVKQETREPSQDVYTLDVDGVVVPLVQFYISREATRETARIVVPLIFNGIVAMASALTINLESFDVYGVPTDIILFTGSLDTYQTTKRSTTANCVGAVSYPANAVRDFGDVSYKTDDGNYYSYRARVDPRFYPGDVGKFGVRQINVNRVTFSVTRYQAIMEISDIGQV
jgi:hypothetical protein